MFRFRKKLALVNISITKHICCNRSLCCTRFQLRHFYSFILLISVICVLTMILFFRCGKRIHITSFWIHFFGQMRMTRNLLCFFCHSMSPHFVSRFQLDLDRLGIVSFYHLRLVPEKKNEIDQFTKSNFEFATKYEMKLKEKR